MSGYLMAKRENNNQRPIGSAACPSCGGVVSVDATHCPACGFTGEHTMRLFPQSPPPLLPLLDAAGLWDEKAQKKIEKAREAFIRSFPQFRFHIYSVSLPEETCLSTFGFWLLNVSPFYVNETAEERQWSILLVLNANTGTISVSTGYAAEKWMSDEEWRKVIMSMATPWKDGRTEDAVVAFMQQTENFLYLTWKARGLRSTKRNKA